MATLTIELSQDTAVRLEREAEQRGMDLQTYVRLLLSDQATADFHLRRQEQAETFARQPPSPDDEVSWLDSPEALVAAIRARGLSGSPCQEAKADLAELLRTGGVAQGISPVEWDRRWAEYEARQKALDLADSEETLREVRQLLGSKDLDR